jgi:AraC family transcriptional regulator
LKERFKQGMNTSTTPIIESETEFCPPELFYPQIAGLGVTIAKYHLAPNDAAFAPLPIHLITWNLGKPGELTRIQDGRTQTATIVKGGTTLTPADQPRHWRWNHNVDVLQLQLQPQLIAQIATASEIDIGRIELMNRFGVYDPQLESIGKSLLIEMRSGGLAGQLYTESLVNLLVIHLLRQYSVFAPPQVSSQFSPFRFKQVIAYIHDNLAQNLSLADLAKIANLSPSRFTRVFRQETGLSPHQYLIQARIERAKHLLRSRGELSIGEIAHQVGFADQSHFTRHFKRIVGVTPKVVLQESRNVLNYSPNIQARET